MNDEQKKIIEEIKILIEKLEVSENAPQQKKSKWRGGTPDTLPPKS